jgi:hypothetical protein
MTVADPSLSIATAQRAQEIVRVSNLAARRPRWDSVAAGVAATLTMLALLDVLGIGIGILPGASGSAATPYAFGWGFAYWILTTLASLYVGGYTVGYFIGDAGQRLGFGHGLLVWCACVLLGAAGVIGSNQRGFGSFETAGMRSAHDMMRSVYQADALLPNSLLERDGGAADFATPQLAAERLLLPADPGDFDAAEARDFLAAGLTTLVANDDDSTMVDRDALIRVIAKTADVSKREASARLIKAERDLRLARDEQLDQAHEEAAISAKLLLALIACTLLGGIAAALGGHTAARPRP